MADFEQLIARARKTAGTFGGLLSLLLAVKGGAQVSFANGSFYVGGHKVPAEMIRKELDRIELRIAATIALYNTRLWKGEWTLAKWREEMDKLVENSHLLFGGLALGSVALAAVNSTVERHIERDLGAVERFKTAIERKQVPSLPLAQNRGRAYIRSFRVSYQILEHKEKIEAGYNEAKRILTPAEHCHSELKPPYRDGCFEVAMQGWMPIAQMPPIGTLLCGQFCKCYLIYR